MYCLNSVLVVDEGNAALKGCPLPSPYFLATWPLLVGLGGCLLLPPSCIVKVKRRLDESSMKGASQNDLIL